MVSSRLVSKAAPAASNRSPSPVQSMVTAARIAKRPSLLSNTAPPTVGTGVSSRITGATAQQWNRVCTPRSRTRSLDASFSISGSMVGDQATTPRWALARGPQYSTSSASRLPQYSRSGPMMPPASTPQRSMNSSPTPATTSRPSQSVMRSMKHTWPPEARPPRCP